MVPFAATLRDASSGISLEQEPEEEIDMSMKFLKRFPHFKQNNSSDCGPTSLRMIARHYGLDYSTEMLRENATATARVFDKFGVLIWQQSLGTFEAGKHKVTLSPDIRPGYHVLNISAGKQVLRTIIVKKGDN